MLTMKPLTARVLFFVVAILALVVHFLLFQLRYGWYLKADDFSFLLAGYAVCSLAVIALWALLPSRLLVAATGLIAFIFPPMLQGNKFVPLDVRFAGFVMLSLLLLVGATELQRRARAHRA